MRSEEICGICCNDNLQYLGARIYHQQDIEKLDSYEQNRYRVLFGQWFPGQNQVKLKIVLCKRCGFIFYLPRPQEKDIDQKYRYLQECAEKKDGISPFAAGEIKRARLIYKYLASVIKLDTVSRILDYGGNDGRLMKPFVDAGKSCFLVDYNPSVIQDVTKLGDTVNDLKNEDAFDLIYCSHLLEHLADPLDALKKFLKHLNPDGYLFVEVPMEIIGRLPLQKEPVTHINFFSPNSLANLLAQSGFHLIDCRLDSCLHSSGNRNFGIRAIGQKCEDVINDMKRNEFKKPDALDYIKPDFLSAVKLIMINPGILKRFFLYKIRQYMGSSR